MASASAAAMAQGCVVGVQNGRIEPRLEIDEFILDKDLLNLFLLALIQLQDPGTEQEKAYLKPWSWFQITGIHGRPFTAWDNVKDQKKGDGVFAGYCSHAAVTFPTWHRPYVAMMEQAVYVAMVEIANKFTDKTTKENYLNLCEKFRFPYWDPCCPRTTSLRDDKSKVVNEYGIPLIVSTPEVYVRKPSNPSKLELVHNPLYQYSFPADEQYLKNADFLWTDLARVQQNNLLVEGGNTHTIRAPNKLKQTSDSYITDRISGHIQSDVGSSLYKVLTVHQNWGTFSNNADDQPNSTPHTIEGFHDNIHGFCGQGTLSHGSGHMGDPQIAAFDPIFWLHHCNVDRITAMWQTNLGLDNPDSWWQEQTVAESNWMESAGAKLTPDSPLTPFRKFPRTPGHEFWTSKDCRDWKVFGYTYLGKNIVPGSSGNNEIMTFPIDLQNTNKSYLTKYFGQFYSWMDTSGMETHQPTPDLIKQFYPLKLSTVEALTGIHTAEPPSTPKADPSWTPSQPKADPSRTPSQPKPDTTKPNYSHLGNLIKSDRRFRQWNAFIHCEKFALQGSFQVFIFIGPFPTDSPDDWAQQPNVVTHTIFASDPHSGGCENCESQEASGLVIADVVPLTAHLIPWIKSGKKCPPDDPAGAVGLQSLERDDVLKFLTKNLHWRVATIQGAAHNRVEVPGLRVGVFDQVVVLPEFFDKSPVYEKVNLTAGVA